MIANAFQHLLSNDTERELVEADPKLLSGPSRSRSDSSRRRP
jgi:hypothetical protein